MGHKSGTFSGTDDYVKSNDLTLVYSGSPTLGNSTGWEKFTLNHGSFTYNGMDNLVVVVTRKSSTYDFTLKYYCYIGSGYGLHRGSDYYSEYGDVTSSNSYETTDMRPSIRMVIEKLEKCATPTIDYVDGKLNFSCETEGVEYVYNITSAKSGSGTNISMPNTYKVTVYATKDGYNKSDVAMKEISVGSGESGIRGDVNLDGEVGMPDVMFIVNHILNGKFPDEE